jgi:ribosome-binding factor A
MISDSDWWIFNLKSEIINLKFEMASRRVLKAAEAIREVVSTAILVELRDPRVEGVTVTFVEVSPDMRTAKVHVSVMGDERQQELCLHGLRSSAGFLQQKVAQRIDTRYTPRLQFHLDRGVKNSIAISRILKDVLGEDGSSGAAREASSIESAERDQPD